MLNSNILARRQWDSIASRILGARLWRRSWLPLAAMLVFAQVAMLGQFLATDGIPRGGDMAVNAVNGSVAMNGTWHELWDDTRAPSQVKHVSRFSISDLALTWVIRLTGDLFLSIRFMVWGFHIIGMLGMYLYVSRVTGSKLAGALAGLVFVFSRGAPLRAIMAMMAGFVLIPFLFLAVDRFLVGPSIRRALLLALMLALYATASIPPFTYISALAIAVYVGAFLISKGMAALRNRAELPALLKIGGFGFVALFATLLLAAYYLTGLALSTVPLVGDAGGYELESLASGLPTFSEALTFQRGAASLNTSGMNAAIWMLAIAVLLTPLLRFNWRVVALVIIAIGWVYFASDATSGVYTFMYDNLPFFSSVRGTRRWTALTLFSFSGLIGILLSASFAYWRDFANNPSTRNDVMRRAAGVLSIVLVSVVAINVLTQLPALRAWLAPYSLDGEYLAPYLWLKETPTGTVYATTPFLTKRLKDDDFDLGVAHGKKAGQGISGRPAFDVFQSGGKKVNTLMFDLVSDSKAFPTNLFEEIQLSSIPASLADRPIRGPRSVKNFLLSGRVTVTETENPDSFVRVRFHRFSEDGEEGFHALDLYPETASIELKRVVGDSITVLASASAVPTDLREYDLKLIINDGRFEAWIDDVRVIETGITKFSGSDVQVLSLGADASFTGLDMSVISSGLDSDYSLARTLGLFNTRYFVVQPNTSEFERQRIATLPGLTEINRWGSSVLYENDYFLDGKAFITQSFGVYVGDPVAVVHGLYQLDPIARSKTALIGISDLPLDLASEILGKAAFVAIDASSGVYPVELARLEELRASITNEGRMPPIVYAWDLTLDESVISNSDPPSPLAVSDGEWELLGRGKNFVLETVLKRQSSGAVANARIRFRVRNDGRFYELVLNRSDGTVTLFLQRDRGVTVVAEGVIPSRAEVDLPVRLAAMDENFVLYLDNRLALETPITRISLGGSIQVSSGGGDLLLATPKLLSGDSSLADLEGIARQGFTLEQMAARSGDLAEADIALLGFTQLLATSVRQNEPTSYQLLVSGDGFERPGVEVWLSDSDSQSILKLETPEVQFGDSAQSNSVSQWQFTSEPFTIADLESNLVVATRSANARISQMLLVEVPDGILSENDSDSLASLLNPPAATGLITERLSAGRYSSEWSFQQGGVLVFQDTFHKGWNARLGDESLPQFKVFGSLNGYWVSPETASNADSLVLNFAPQGRYRRAQIISGLAFLVVVGLLLSPVAWRR